ncbi:putative ribosomal RNA small subunit methyltransferase D [Octadecabacter antarcticus 307]|uniref:Putative ribosomal RNA small subunit methyltransferase D n=1 Tax=Octadecabacter antarcticus 307 TaxID=391626 RepID=M9R7F1_9RHOB|nr:16S rRNA (guanine(966)-N(2))-methyltransferase RsmD [Octadecabacter antarcticus]AGI66256.1 putative ribosomal RNA small subunit methyltransferase D [Octadecabacter antarcticus 307]
MRIIGGQHRGLTLADVGTGDAAAHLRPTPDRVRESLFNVLMGHGLPHGARVLDLFAGTGALGIEALSRGAVHATFVDNGRIAQGLIRENLTKTRRTLDATVLICAAHKLPATSAPCQLVFVDPPYGKHLGGPAVLAAQALGWLAAGALIVMEDSAPQPMAGFAQIDLRRYGDTHITILCTP